MNASSFRFPHWQASVQGQADGGDAVYRCRNKFATVHEALKGGLRDKNVFTVDGDDVHIDDL